MLEMPESEILRPALRSGEFLLQRVWIPGRCLGCGRCSWERAGGRWRGGGAGGWNASALLEDGARASTTSSRRAEEQG